MLLYLLEASVILGPALAIETGFALESSALNTIHAVQGSFLGITSAWAFKAFTTAFFLSSSVGIFLRGRPTGLDLSFFTAFLFFVAIFFTGFFAAFFATGFFAFADLVVVVLDLVVVVLDLGAAFVAVA